MIKRLTAGQYRHKDSVIHILDARLKIFYVLLLGIVSFTIKSGLDILIFSLFIFSLAFMSGMKPGDLVKNLRPFYFMFVFLAMMYLIFSRGQLESGMIYIWRFLMLIIISLILTFTTTIADLITAIERLSWPLAVFGIKPRNTALIVSVAVRFIPVMFANFESAREAMLSRMGDFRRLKHIKTIILVVLQKMIGSASNLSDAISARLYDENIKSSRILKLGKHDYVSAAVIAILVAVIY